MPYVLNGVKWGSATNGTAATVNWSFADNPALDTQLAQTYSGYTDFDASISGSFRDIVRSVFSLWDLLTGITFVEVADSTSSLLRVGTDFIDGPGNTIGLATWYSNGAGSITQATIEFEPEAFNDANIFYLIGLHELGHAIGPRPLELVVRHHVPDGRLADGALRRRPHRRARPLFERARRCRARPAAMPRTAAAPTTSSSASRAATRSTVMAVTTSSSVAAIPTMRPIRSSAAPATTSPMATAVPTPSSIPAETT